MGQILLLFVFMLLTFQIIQILSAFLTIVLILLHAAKGEGIGSIGSSAQMFSSVSSIEKGLNIITWICGIAFMLCSAALSWGLIK